MTDDDTRYYLRMANGEALATILEEVRHEAWKQGREAANEWAVNPF